ncbi:hypothetical protein [Amycolatopsis rhizosphaerae]|uniref:hypothetical protein n=1 Tax=Amycolatopsis rhizosphaerae TaxID=2053003 RepID=UPI001643D9E6|nr:hypothetical protein [Amycolatopsis rhizosphaerae]
MRHSGVPKRADVTIDQSQKPVRPGWEVREAGHETRLRAGARVETPNGLGHRWMTQDPAR